VQNTRTESIFNCVPPTSADVDIDIDSLGITLDQNEVRNKSEIVLRQTEEPSTKRNSKRNIDAVSLTDYCLRRLSEIRQINEISHTPSAYSCLMSFIGFLASLVYEGQNETDAYPKFVHDYIKELYCARIIKKDNSFHARSSGHPHNNSWGEVIYSLVRCGLVHNMNETGKEDNQNQIKVALTHLPFQGKCCKLYKFGLYKNARLIAGNDETAILVLNVFDLCDAVQKAIIRMFQKQKVRVSAGRMVAHRPVIRQIS